MTEELPEDGVGYLTWDEFERFRNAVAKTRRLVPWLRIAGYIRNGDHDEMKHRSTDRPLGLPPTWLAAEEITSLLNEINQWPELEDVATYGHEFAWQLTHEVETADARWPQEDRSHQVRIMRCNACDRLSLRYHPPKQEGERITVRCREKDCRAVMDEDMFTFAAALIESENNAKRLGNSRGSAHGGGEIQADGLPVGA
tara:strand:- start:302 stop:898 length:597 start_codon:yes stop_codon:yes gene_type:complete